MPTKMRLKKLFCFTNAAKIQRDEWSDCGMKDEHDRRSLSTESSEFNVTADEESESVATTKSGSSNTLLKMSLAIAQIVSECIRNRDDPVTFLPLLATIVTHRVMGRLVKHKSDYTRRLSYEESYRVVRASLERLHRRANRRLFYMDGNRIEVDKGYDDDDKTIVDGCKKGSYLKFVHWDSTQIRLRDSKIQMITYELLEIGMKMTDSDIEFVIGSCRVDL